MRVRLTTQISGTRNGKDWPLVGSVVDLPDHEARDMIASGQATRDDEGAVIDRYSVDELEPTQVHRDGHEDQVDTVPPGSTAQPVETGADLMDETVETAESRTSTNKAVRGRQQVTRADPTGDAPVTTKANEPAKATTKATDTKK